MLISDDFQTPSGGIVGNSAVFGNSHALENPDSPEIVCIVSSFFHLLTSILTIVSLISL